MSRVFRHATKPSCSRTSAARRGACRYRRERPGLLHAHRRASPSTGINLLMAKIMTLGDRVEDVFIVDEAGMARPASSAV